MQLGQRCEGIGEIDPRSGPGRAARLTPEELVRISSRGATLHERLRLPAGSFDAPAPGDCTLTRLERWCRHAAAGDRERFDARLAQLGHSAASVRRYLADDASSGEAPRAISPWALKLGECLAWAGDRTGAEPAPDLLDPSSPIPFEDALRPFVDFAGCRLRTASSPGLESLSGEALRALARRLLEDLARVAAEPLYLEFSLFRQLRARGRRLENLCAGHSGDGEGGRRFYLDYCRHLTGGGFVPFFLEYSFLARRIVSLVETWIEAVSELVERLDADRAELARCFARGTDPGRVLAAEPGLSDRHDRGRTVFVLTFESGLRLVYKPKRLDTECLFRRLTDRLDRWLGDGRGPSLPRLRYLLRPDYGWVDYVEHRPCEDDYQTARFFRRAGRLLGLVFGLNGYDLHAENVVACGEHPVPVDLETLFQPDPASPRSSFVDAEQLFTVLGTAFLPRWSRGPHLEPVDMSGLVAPEASDLEGGAAFSLVNTDRVGIVLRPPRIEPSRNLPHRNGVTGEAGAHVEEIVQGFTESYRFWLEARSAPPGDFGVLGPSETRRTRHIIRNTRTYSVLQEQASSPECSREGVDASLVLEGLSRAFLGEKPGSDRLRVLESEMNALLREDVPIFHVTTDSRSLLVPGAPEIEGFFRRSGHDAFLRHLDQLGPDDLGRQVALIRGAFFAHGAAFDSSPDSGSPVECASGAPADARRLVEAADGLGKRILGAAFPDGAGNLSWFGISADAAIRRFRLDALPLGFYGGQGGIALFLAAMEKALPGKGYREAALASLGMASDELRALRGSFRIGARMGIGGMTGLASVIFSFLRAGALIGEGRFVEDALTLSGLVTPRLVEQDGALDVTGGSAGAILVLLALHAQTGRQEVLARATACGEHLLRRRARSPSGPRAWPTLEGRMHTGLSHGAAGISLSLWKLADVTGRIDFAEAAREGVEYERSLFVADASGWLDLRQPHRAFAHQWCHGSVGIGYSRLGMVGMTSSHDLLPEVVAALQATSRQPIGAVDHLCCGNAGQVSWMFDAARFLRLPEWEAAAWDRLGRLLTLRGPGQTYRYFPEPDPGGSRGTRGAPVFQPSFMQGAAGIGYAWLRIARPDLRLPLALTLE